MKARIHYLDGIRGWAALSVLLFHAFWESFGALFPALRSTALSFPFNGPLAVSIFFVLSGDALLSPYIATGNLDTVRNISLRRYSRLTIPIFMSCLLSYGVMKAGLAHHIEAAHVLHREDWMGVWAPCEASLTSVVKYGLFDVYVRDSVQISYNPFLWTMSIEMLGSMLIFVFALQIQSLKRPELVALGIAVLLFMGKSYQALFFMGAFFSLIRAQGFFVKHKGIALQAASWIALAVSIASCIHSPNIVEDSSRTNAWRATLFVFAVHANPWLIALFETRLSKFLGHISFSLYLVQFAVLMSLTSFLAVYLANKGNLTQETAWMAGIATVLATVVVAWLFAKVEAIVLRYANDGLKLLQK
jgi:peptidoglycan/LPS O-acetylase OafA/YrhL